MKEEKEYGLKELMNLELLVFGFYLTNHPVSQYKIKYNSLDLSVLENYVNTFVEIVVYVDKLKKIETKNNGFGASGN